MGQGECSILFAYKGGQYNDYRLERLINILITWHTGPKVVDTLLTFILPQVYPHYTTIHFGTEHQ